MKYIFGLLFIVLVMAIIIWNWQNEPPVEFFTDDMYLDRIKLKLIAVYPDIESKLILKSSYSSYTKDKKIIYLCLRNPETGKFYDEATILYVALHEVAHLISKSYSIENHNQEFIDNFEMLRQRAVNLGFLPMEFHVNSQYYCKLI